MFKRNLKISDSIVFWLIAWVFSIYCILTIVLTFVQMYTTFSEEKEQTIDSLTRRESGDKLSPKNYSYSDKKVSK